MTATGESVLAPLEAAREVAELARASAGEIEASRELTRPLFEALADAGMFHLLIPRTLGGLEVDWPTYVSVVAELGRADASTAWCVNQGAVYATYSTVVPQSVARLVWGSRRQGVVANTPSPDALAVAVDGGFRVNGRLRFSTGCRHASWIAARARVVSNGAEGVAGGPDIRYLLMPVEQVEILDTWHVRGMRGTGTNDFRVTDVVVPRERTYSPFVMPPAETGPLYVIPRTLLFASGDAAISLGVAQSSLEALIELAAGKQRTHTPGLLRDVPAVQMEIGQAEAILRSGWALLNATVREVWEGVQASGAITRDQRAALRLAMTHAIRLGAQVVDIAYNAAGATAIFEGSRLQRYFQDAHVMTQHYQGRTSHYETVGRYRLGLDIDELAM